MAKNTSKKTIEKPQLKIPDLDNGEKVKLSYSKLNIFQQCPKQYYYRYLRKDITEKPTVWPGNVTGRILHSAMENAINEKNKNVDDKIIIFNIKGKFQEMYEVEVKKCKKDYKTSKEIRSDKDKFFRNNDRLMTSLVKFILSYFYNEDNIKVIPEEEYVVEWKWDPEIKLNGFLDVRLQSEEYTTQRIFDLKVTKESENFYFVDWDNMLQKLVYEYFIFMKYGVIPHSFTYLVLNREEKTLFFKEKFRTHDLFNIKEYFSKLHIRLQELKEYTLNPDITLVNPEEVACRWCIYSRYCEDKFQGKYIKLMKNKKR